MYYIQSLYQFLHLGSPTPPLSRLDIFLSLLKILISCIGTLVILSGVLVSAYHYFMIQIIPKKALDPKGVDLVRRDLGRTIILGLEFIIAADVIETTTTPNYYSVGILAIIVAIRTFLTFTLNREISKSELPESEKLED